ncbi:MAG: T9SS type A sorting domain-containing protein [Bacteroidota bacterium]|nr:T9SS type A sorting domain-containing protein [Bacteroidota bacterium]
MKHKKIKLITLLLLGLSFNEIKAQDAMPAGGGDASGSGGSVSYSVGQVIYTSNIGIDGSVGQGIQQPYEIFIISGIEETIELNFKAYPNPTRDLFVLRFENDVNKKYTYHLFDLTGKLLESKTITSNETTISMGNLVPATYFLKVTINNQEVKTFKIIKN